MNEQLQDRSQWLDRETFGDMDIPEELHANLQRHRQHLAILVANMRSIGISDEMIEMNVSTIVASYKEELLRSIRAMAR